MEADCPVCGLPPGKCPAKCPGHRVKSFEELLAEGGRFYALGGRLWCDTPLESWVLVPGVGYVEGGVDRDPPA